MNYPIKVRVRQHNPTKNEAVEWSTDLRDWIDTVSKGHLGNPVAVVVSSEGDAKTFCLFDIKIEKEGKS